MKVVEAALVVAVVGLMIANIVVIKNLNDLQMSITPIETEITAISTKLQSLLGSL